MKLALGPVVASRTYRDSKSGKTIRVRIGKPLRGDVDWICPYHISGLGLRGTQRAYGIDSIQALEGALERVRATLEGCGRRLEWFAGVNGDIGIQKLVPPGFTPDLRKRIDQAIEREFILFNREAERGYARKARNRGRLATTPQSSRRKSSPRRNADS
jgi:hypothetical protein